jgi:hypothetical protein
MTTNRPFFGGFLAAFRAQQPNLQKTTASQAASVASYSQTTEPDSRHSSSFLAHNHHQDALTVARCNDGLRASNRPFPANQTTHRPLQPLHIPQGPGLPNTRRVPTRQTGLGQLVRRLPRSHGRREVVHWRPDSNGGGEVLQAGHGQATQKRRPLESRQAQHMRRSGQDYFG